MGPELDGMLDAKAVLIAGPTASGKSAAALGVAEAVGKRGRKPLIVNADSMQVYDALRILTARPRPADEERTPHRLYGHVGSEIRYSVGAWLADVTEVLAGSLAADALPIIVGGTGLYFMALTEGLAETPPVPDDVRGFWAGELKSRGAGSLHAELSRRDSRSAAAIRPGDPQRILRALEVLDATGASITEWRGRQRPAVLPAGEAIRVVVEPDRDELYRRIDQRFDVMVEQGALDEVRELMGRGLDPALPVMKAIGIREFGAHLSGDMRLAEATEAAKMQTRRYAKRQMTWFRHQMPEWARLVV